jgi:hypothetical protein
MMHGTMNIKLFKFRRYLIAVTEEKLYIPCAKGSQKPPYFGERENTVYCFTAKLCFVPHF